MPRKLLRELTENIANYEFEMRDDLSLFTLSLLIPELKLEQSIELGPQEYGFDWYPQFDNGPTGDYIVCPTPQQLADAGYEVSQLLNVNGVSIEQPVDWYQLKAIDENGVITELTDAMNYLEVAAETKDQAMEVFRRLCISNSEESGF